MKNGEIRSSGRSLGLSSLKPEWLGRLTAVQEEGRLRIRAATTGGFVRRKTEGEVAAGLTAAIPGFGSVAAASWLRLPMGLGSGCFRSKRVRPYKGGFGSFGVFYVF